MTTKHCTLYAVYDIIIIEDIFVTTKEINIMYEIIYNNEVIGTAKEYRIAFKSGSVWYKRGDK